MKVEPKPLKQKVLSEAEKIKAEKLLARLG